jgi:hypothetical protein
MIVSLRQARVLTDALTEIDYMCHLKRCNTDWIVHSGTMHSSKVREKKDNDIIFLRVKM